MRSPRFLFLAVFTFSLSFSVSGQNSDEQDVKRMILQYDSIFWQAYNACDVPGMERFVTDDLEFYHDKGGPSKGKDQFAATTRKNLCSNDNFRVRREAVESSVHVFVMKNHDTTYGAIITGEHVFHVKEKGKNERRSGLARFTHLWILEDTTWKMSRVLSYDHGPAPYVNTRKEIPVSTKLLDLYAGKYIGPKSGKLTVKRDKSLLKLEAGNHTMVLHPESPALFFSMDRDLQFEFIIDATEKVVAMTVRENGNIVEQAVRE